ncbi:S8 family serine peptidase [Pseudomonas frederiksbergensis]|uniref:S8 family serine peptidase n=1 Tax=Pseudomonas frederiksbergensis TaxID=104087 RepID=UPI001C838096|nr:S8 family serine peptidase [Pseudomonas frederiksbergensis]
MFDDSHAPSWTPKDIFSSEFGCRIVATAFDGYLIEANIDSLELMAKHIKTATSIVDKVDISRIQSVKLFDASETLRNKNIDGLWIDDASGTPHQFVFWLLPFTDATARQSVAREILELYIEKKIIFGDESFANPFNRDRPTRTTQSGHPIDGSLVRILETYIKTGTASFSAEIKSLDDLKYIAASGSAYRIEPVSRILSNSTPPGDGKEPTIPTRGISNLPVVVIVDGGNSARSYKPLEVWSAPPLVDDFSANQIHGNQITSLVCQGHAWNNNLILPELACRFVTAQAITKSGVSKQPTQDQFLDYLREVAKETKDLSKVWNLSFNEMLPSSNPDEISFLGHEINKISREFGILPIISIGNKSGTGASLLCPPADCEAAITVSGRVASPTGEPSTGCPVSLRGPAPGGMKKPDLSWFSHLRMIGGVTNTGTSYSAALMSSLASHTFLNLKSPTPDLVRALLINGAERTIHSNDLGWGTPWSPDSLPWLCKDGTVTLAWVSRLKPGVAYYWNEIPVPAEMIVDGKLKGKASLTAIIKPVVSELGGANYFSTRLQVALQATSTSGKTINLLGSMKESKDKEVDARSELAKWSPIRRHASPFSGKSMDMNSLRLHARIYTRDLYQFQLNSHHDLAEQEVAFVLSFEGAVEGSSIYNTMTSRLGTSVESAIIEQSIDVHVGGNS